MSERDPSHGATEPTPADREQPVDDRPALTDIERILEAIERAEAEAADAQDAADKARQRLGDADAAAYVEPGEDVDAALADARDVHLKALQDAQVKADRPARLREALARAVDRADQAQGEARQAYFERRDARVDEINAAIRDIINGQLAPLLAAWQRLAVFGDDSREGTPLAAPWKLTRQGVATDPETHAATISVEPAVLFQAIECGTAEAPAQDGADRDIVDEAAELRRMRSALSHARAVLAQGQSRAGRAAAAA